MWYQFRKIGGLGALLLPLVLVLGLGGYAAWQDRKVVLIALDGEPAEATITAKRRSSSTASTTTATGRTETTRYLLGYSFEVPGLGTQTGESEVSRDYYLRRRTGDRVTLTYLPFDPETVEIEPGSLSGSSFVWWWFAGLAMLVWVGVLGGSLAKAARMQRLARTGTRITGQLRHVSIGDTLASFTFAYTDAAGTEHEGRTLLHEKALLEGLAKGASVPLAHDPERPHTAFWLGDLAGPGEPVSAHLPKG